MGNVAHLADLIAPPAVEPFTAAGSKAYVPNRRLHRDAQALEPVSKRTDPQADIVDARGVHHYVPSGGPPVFAEQQSCPRGCKVTRKPDRNGYAISVRCR